MKDRATLYVESIAKHIPFNLDRIERQIQMSVTRHIANNEHLTAESITDIYTILDMHIHLMRTLFRGFDGLMLDAISDEQRQRFQLVDLTHHRVSAPQIFDEVRTFAITLLRAEVELLLPEDYKKQLEQEFWIERRPNAIQHIIQAIIEQLLEPEGLER